MKKRIKEEEDKERRRRELLEAADYNKGKAYIDPAEEELFDDDMSDADLHLGHAGEDAPSVSKHELLPDLAAVGAILKPPRIDSPAEPARSKDELLPDVAIVGALVEPPGVDPPAEPTGSNHELLPDVAIVRVLVEPPLGDPPVEQQHQSMRCCQIFSVQRKNRRSLLEGRRFALLY